MCFLHLPGFYWGLVHARLAIDPSPCIMRTHSDVPLSSPPIDGQLPLDHAFPPQHLFIAFVSQDTWCCSNIHNQHWMSGPLTVGGRPEAPFTGHLR